MGGFDSSRYRYLFFDIDGVVLDSVHVKTEAFRELYLPYGEDIARRVVDHHLANGGVSRFEKFRIYHGEYLGQPIDESKVQDLAGQFSRMVFEKVLAVPFINGAINFLQQMEGLGKEMFVITGTPQDEIEQILDKRDLTKFFLSVKGSPRKKEDSLREILEERSVPAEQSVLFGDSVTDREAAERNSVDFVAVNYEGDSDGFSDFADLIQRSGL